MKFVPFLEIPQIAIVLALFLWAAIGWNSAPARIAVHWNLRGEVDRYGGKFQGLLLVPIIAAVLYLSTLFTLGAIGNRNVVALSFTVFRFAFLITLAGVYAMIQFNARGYGFSKIWVVILLLLADSAALANSLWRAVAASRVGN